MGEKEVMYQLDDFFGLPHIDWESETFPVCEGKMTGGQPFGYPHSDDTKKKISSGLKGNQRRCVPVTYNGVSYPSIAKAAEAYGITPKSMSRRLGRTKDHKYLKEGLSRKSRIPALDANK